MIFWLRPEATSTFLDFPAVEAVIDAGAIVAFVVIAAAREAGHAEFGGQHGFGDQADVLGGAGSAGDPIGRRSELAHGRGDFFGSRHCGHRKVLSLEIFGVCVQKNPKNRAVAFLAVSAKKLVAVAKDSVSLKVCVFVQKEREGGAGAKDRKAATRSLVRVVRGRLRGSIRQDQVLAIPLGP